jgi:hypothetical protein
MARAPRDAHGRLLYTPVAGDVVVLRRAHPCGSDRMVVTLVGLDIRLTCSGCGARVMLTRQRLQARIREVAGTVADLQGSQGPEPPIQPGATG